MPTNRTITFHGDATKLLVTLFEGSTVPPISPRERVDAVAPIEPTFQNEQSNHSLTNPVPHFLLVNLPEIMSRTISAT